MTKLSNLDNIKREGLKPSVPPDMSTEDEGVYVFKTEEDAEDAQEDAQDFEEELGEEGKLESFSSFIRKRK